MVSLLGKFGALGLIAVLVLGAFFIPAGADESRAVDYSLSKDDPSGDSEGLGDDSTVKTDSDIIQITSTKSGDNIVLTMKVSGIINLFDSVYTTAYQFNIDVDGDDSVDWLVTKGQYVNYQGTDSQLQDDHDTAPTLYYLENATGDETDTVTMQFPLSYITDVEAVESWNIYATSSEVKLSPSISSYVDTAPDDEFGDTGGGNGGGEDPTKNEDMSIIILKPEADEKIPAGGITDTYRIEGEATPPIGDTIDHMNFRVLEAQDPGWQTAYDDSGGSTYAKWYGEMSTYAVMGSGNLANGKNTLEVKATTTSGDYNTATVIFYFNSDGTEDTDRDDDGMPNDYEDANGLDPDDASDADEDADGDGYTNLAEYKAGTDPNDDTDQPGGGTGGYDPTTEEPTDKVIKVSISSAKWVVKDIGEDLVKYDIQISGTTSGVKYCELLMVPYYNGVAEADDEWMEPFDWEDEAGEKAAMKDFGYTAFWFKSTSGDDWKTWELKITGDINTSGMGDDDDFDSSQEPDKVMVYVRAYSDTSGNNWNQASKEIKISTSGDSDKDDDKDESPGFEAVFTIMALAVVVIISRVYYRRK